MRLGAIVTALALLAGFVAGDVVRTSADQYADRAGERIVAALPGIGDGWIDTLRRIAGPAQIDTLSALMVYDVEYGFPGARNLIGMFEPWHMRVTLHPYPLAYTRYTSNWNQCREAWGYRHPVEVTSTPAGTIAHEFGHRLQFGLRRQPPQSRADTLPTWAQDQSERFADRFARAVLALRGWADPDTADVMMNHYVRYRLIKSYWEE